MDILDFSTDLCLLILQKISFATCGGHYIIKQYIFQSYTDTLQRYCIIIIFFNLKSQSFKFKKFILI